MQYLNTAKVLVAGVGSASHLTVAADAGSAMTRHRQSIESIVGIERPLSVSPGCDCDWPRVAASTAAWS